MRDFQQAFWGVLIALLSAGIILGSLSIALVEGGMTAGMEITPTLLVRLITQPIPSIIPSENESPTTTTTIKQLTTSPMTSTPKVALLSATPRCPQPRGWSVYVIQPGDTLDNIAERFNTSSEALAHENCLEVSALFPGTELYVPNVYPTEVVVQCGPPARWVFYTVLPGDTLYHLSRLFRVTVAQLQYANCLGSSTLIRAGQRLYVPYVPTSTPRVVPTDTEQPQPSGTSTSVPSATEVSTLTPTPIPTLTTTPTSTSTATMIPTINPTQTPSPTSTVTDMPTATNTSTDIPTVTATPTSLSTATATELPPTEVPTATATPNPPTATDTITPKNY